MEIKKGLMRLVLGASLLVTPVTSPAQDYSPNIKRVANSLKECIKQNRCGENFENLRKQIGIKKGESQVDGSRIFYYNYEGERYLGSIVDSQKNGKITIYYSNEIVGSSKREFTKKIAYEDGDEYLVIGNFSPRKDRAQKAERDWQKRIDNNSKFKHDLRFDKGMQAEYNATIDQRGAIAEILLREDINCTIVHERVPHYHNNPQGEALAYANELTASPYALKGIEDGASRIPKDSSEEYYTKVKRKVKNGLIRIAGSERKLYQADRAQLKKYAEQLKQELSH